MLFLERRSPHKKSPSYLEVITGRGNRSRYGKPRIKPAVVEYLKRHGYRYLLYTHSKYVFSTVTCNGLGRWLKIGGRGRGGGCNTSRAPAFREWGAWENYQILGSANVCKEGDYNEQLLSLYLAYHGFLWVLIIAKTPGNQTRNSKIKFATNILKSQVKLHALIISKFFLPFFLQTGGFYILHHILNWN